MKIFLDANIIMDVFQKREPFYESSSQIIDLVYADMIQGVTSPLNIANIYYLLHNGRSGTLTEPEAASMVRQLLEVFSVSDLDNDIIRDAMFSNFEDKEDAIQYFPALGSKAKYLITRNVKDFERATDVEIMTPSEFLDLSAIKNKLKKMLADDYFYHSYLF